jgi:hypothetical protein
MIDSCQRRRAGLLAPVFGLLGCASAKSAPPDRSILLPDQAREVTIADGAERLAILVAPTGKDGNDCGLAPEHPCHSIGWAIGRAASFKPVRPVLIAVGTYEETVELRPGVHLRGGYTADFEQGPGAGESIVEEGRLSEEAVALRIKDLSVETEVESLTLRAAAASKPGASSYGILVLGYSPGLRLRQLKVFAGNGADGTAGSSGQNSTSGTTGGAGRIAACEPGSGGREVARLGAELDRTRRQLLQPRLAVEQEAAQYLGGLRLLHSEPMGRDQLPVRVRVGERSQQRRPRQRCLLEAVERDRRGQADGGVRVAQPRREAADRQGWFSLHRAQHRRGARSQVGAAVAEQAHQPRGRGSVAPQAALVITTKTAKLVVDVTLERLEELRDRDLLLVDDRAGRARVEEVWQRGGSPPWRPLGAGGNQDRAQPRRHHKASAASGHDILARNAVNDRSGRVPRPKRRTRATRPGIVPGAQVPRPSSRAQRPPACLKCSFIRSHTATGSSDEAALPEPVPA